MTRIVESIISDKGNKKHFNKGVGWQKFPRATRRDKSLAVSRKTKDAVEGISEAAQEKLTNLLSSSADIARHAKRQTIRTTDLDLVSSILSKNGMIF